MSSNVSIKRLRKVLDFDPSTGIFTWRASQGSRAQIGQHPGWVDAYGCLNIKIDGKHYKAHRLAWAWVTGQWPTAEGINHRNRNRADNRFANLRPSTRPEWQQHRPKNTNNQSGFKGVSYSDLTRNKWRATISAGGRYFDLGRFATKREANDAYREASQRLHGEFSGV